MAYHSTTVIKAPDGSPAAVATAARAEEAAQQRILDIIVGQDDVSWKSIIFGLIDSHQMDPWDINISLIAERFIAELRKMQQMDFRIGGKVVLASAILLKMKAERLHDEELGALDSLIQAVESQEEPLLEGDYGLPRERLAYPGLVPRTPQPRKRKVSVYDLIEALEQALDMEARRPPRIAPRVLDVIDPPQHHIDISKVIQEVYRQIFDHYEVRKSPAGSLEFHDLVRGESKRDHVMAFIPLLHLETARKVDLEQQAHFGPITVHLIDPTPPVFEEAKVKQKTRAVPVKRKEKPTLRPTRAVPVTKDRTAGPVKNRVAPAKPKAMPTRKLVKAKRTTKPKRITRAVKRKSSTKKRR